MSFCPVPNYIDGLKLKLDQNDFFRRLRLSEFFSTDTTTDVNSSDVPFRKRSIWTPDVNKDKFLESYISVVEDEILNADRKFFHKNLNVSERVALANYNLTMTS